jgi:hypothetical protein
MWLRQRLCQRRFSGTRWLVVRRYDRPVVALPCLAFAGTRKHTRKSSTTPPQGLTMWMGDWLLQASLRSKVHWQLELEFSCTCTGTSKGPCLGCIRCNSSSLVERSRTERLGLGNLLVGQVGHVGHVGKRLRPGLRSKRSTPAPCASANVALKCRLLPHRVVGLIGGSVGGSVCRSICRSSKGGGSCGVVELGTRGDIFRHNRAVYGLPYIDPA